MNDRNAEKSRIASRTIPLGRAAHLEMSLSQSTRGRKIQKEMSEQMLQILQASGREQITHAILWSSEAQPSDGPCSKAALRYIAAMLPSIREKNHHSTISIFKS